MGQSGQHQGRKSARGGQRAVHFLAGRRRGIRDQPHSNAKGVGAAAARGTEIQRSLGHRAGRTGFGAPGGGTVRRLVVRPGATQLCQCQAKSSPYAGLRSFGPGIQPAGLFRAGAAKTAGGR